VAVLTPQQQGCTFLYLFRLFSVTTQHVYYFIIIHICRSMTASVVFPDSFTMLIDNVLCVCKMLFGFSRDQALPFSSTWQKVDESIGGFTIKHGLLVQHIWEQSGLYSSEYARCH